MKSRGRTSLAESSVVTGSFGKRPEPPEGLTARQREIWRETVASEDPNFFNTAALRSLLVDYCTHSEAAERLRAVINGDAFRSECLSNQVTQLYYERLLKIHAGETHSKWMVAAKLRLTNQSRYTPQGAEAAARRAAKGAKPWEVEAEA